MGRSDVLNLLSSRQCARAVAGEVLRDGGGLFLEVTSAGRKFWRFRYTRPHSAGLPPAKRRNRISLGEFPNPLSLAAARAARDRLRLDLVCGVDPVRSRRDEAARVAQAQISTLKALAETWYAKQSWSPAHFKEWRRNLDRHIFDQIVERRPLGDWPVAEIKVRHVMEVLQRMEDAGLIESLHRCRQKLVHIFNRAIVLELREDNPVLPLTKEFRPRRRNVPGLKPLPWALVGRFQLDLQRAEAAPLTKLAMHFMLHTVQRSTEMRGAQWCEIDWNRALWTIPAERMKGNPSAREDQMVPLSGQALVLLKGVRALDLCREFVFPVQPSPRAKYPFMSENTLQQFCAQLGYKGRMHVHGIRKTFSTRLNELRDAFNSKTDTDAIEMCLDHFERDPIRGTYNHAEHLSLRADIMQRWSDELDRELKVARRRHRCERSGQNGTALEVGIPVRAP